MAVNTTIPLFPSRAIAVSGHDSNFLLDQLGGQQAMAIFVGTAGNVAVKAAGNDPAGATITFAVPAGGFVPVMCSRVLATGTTAGSLIGVW